METFGAWIQWLDDSSIISRYVFVAATFSIFDTLVITVLWSTRVKSVLRRTNVAIGTINELEMRSLLKSQLGAAFVAKSFAL